MQGPRAVEVKSRLGLAVLFPRSLINVLGPARHGLPPIDQLAFGPAASGLGGGGENFPRGPPGGFGRGR